MKKEPVVQSIASPPSPAASPPGPRGPPGVFLPAEPSPPTGSRTPKMEGEGCGSEAGPTLANGTLATKPQVGMLLRSNDVRNDPFISIALSGSTYIAPSLLLSLISI